MRYAVTMSRGDRVRLKADKRRKAYVRQCRNGLLRVTSDDIEVWYVATDWEFVPC